MQQRSYLADAMVQARTRTSWNDRLSHWEKPASDSEEAIIERAASGVRALVAKNNWLVGEGVRIEPQGSYHNNTNVRQESDIDLRAVHPMVDTVYAEGVMPQYADAVLGYRAGTRTFSQVLDGMRREMWDQFVAEFGILNVEDGGKALRVKSVPGSRAPVDVVPCFKLHYVEWVAAWGRYHVTEGMVIFPRGGGYIFNFPEQHHRNGITKRANTQHRFKRNVRMLKRLRDELVDTRVLGKGRVPSFLVECLVYGVEDGYFLYEPDDRFERLVRVVERVHDQLNDAVWVSAAREINGVKMLFGPHQPWTVDTAKQFTAAAWNRLMA